MNEMSDRYKHYSLSVHVAASDNTVSGELGWETYVDEKCSRNADIRDHRETLLRAVIEKAEAELASMGEPTMSAALAEIAKQAPEGSDFEAGGKYAYGTDCGNSDDVEAFGFSRAHYWAAGIARAALGRSG